MTHGKATITTESVANETHYAIGHAQSTIEKALRFMADPDRKERVKQLTCKRCFYIWVGRISGQAFTDAPCWICEEVQTYANTDTDKLCQKCASKHDLCKHCAADLHLRPRRVYGK